MSELKKTVTVTVPVDWRVADLVYFVKKMTKIHGVGLANLTDEELITEAEDFWDSRHGED